MEALFMVVFWVFIALFLVWKSRDHLKNRPGMHPTRINKSPSMKKKAATVHNKAASPLNKKTVASDGHVIPRSDDITCEGQYGHNHGDSIPRYIVHEEPTEGYCILNGKKVALKDCWKL